MDTEPPTDPADMTPSGAGEGQTATGRTDSPVVLISVAPPKPWGPWASIGWAVLCLVLMMVVQLGVLVAFVVVNFATTPRANLKDVPTSALFLSVATLLGTPAVVGLVAALIRIRRCRVRTYLALTAPTARQAFLAGGGFAVLLAATDLVTQLLRSPLVPQVMVDVYRTGWLPLLLLTLLVAAPVGEEVLFRGFLYRGIASSRWGPNAATVVSSVWWALLHVQYDFYAIGVIFVMGLYLGEVRRRTASLPLTVILHGVASAVATVEVFVMTHGLS